MIILLLRNALELKNVEKLIPNLNSKTNYVVHYENLKIYESLGLKITKIHRGIKFEESAWLEEYINLCTKLKIEAKQSGNNVEVDFFKLMNHSVFGKTLENSRNRVEIRLISSDKGPKNLQLSQTMIAVRSSMTTSLPFISRRQSFTLISQSILV